MLQEAKQITPSSTFSFLYLLRTYLQSMTTTGIAKIKLLMLRGSSVRKISSSSKFHTAAKAGDEAEVNSRKGREIREDVRCWVPHPRSGIYVPNGHERVMDDVPASAASFTRTYWLRNVDGVDKPGPDYDLNTSHHTLN